MDVRRKNMRKIHLSVLLLFSVLSLLFLQWGRTHSASAAQQKQAIQEDLTEKTQKAQQDKAILEKLSKQERSIYSDLAEIEDRIQGLLDKIEGYKEKRKQAEKKKQALAKKATALQDELTAQRNELARMLEQLWKLYFQNQHPGLSSWQSFSDADLQFTWLSEIYSTAGMRLEQLQAKEKKLKTNLARQKKHQADISEQLALIQATQDKLLKNRLLFLRRLQKVRTQRLAKEEQLLQIKDTIQDLQYKLKDFESKKIVEFKGRLPWPVNGKLSKTFNPKGNPPQDGFAFTTSKHADVRCIFWGKVVYSDSLRGFGQVVVIFHGKKYYSLYAFLSTVGVSVGQDVEKGEVLGQTGFYPLVEGPGLYFELRQGQSPINPGSWLASQS